MDEFLNDIFIQWHIDPYGTKYSIKRTEESYIVVGHKIVLSEIPDKQNGVRIVGMNESDKIEKGTDFKVDYVNGFVFFSKERDGQTVVIDSYYGRGLIMYPASRIFMSDGKSLEEKIRIIEEKLDALE